MFLINCLLCLRFLPSSEQNSSEGSYHSSHHMGTLLWIQSLSSRLYPQNSDVVSWRTWRTACWLSCPRTSLLKLLHCVESKKHVKGNWCTRGCLVTAHLQPCRLYCAHPPLPVDWGAIVAFSTLDWLCREEARFRWEAEQTTGGRH